MKNSKDELINDAFLLCSEAIKTVHHPLSIGLEKKSGIDVVYNRVQTPFYLAKLGILKFLVEIDKKHSMQIIEFGLGAQWLNRSQSRVRGYFEVDIDNNKALGWMKFVTDSIDTDFLPNRKIITPDIKNAYWPSEVKIEGSKFIFDKNRFISFRSTEDDRFKIFECLFDNKGQWALLQEMKQKLKNEKGFGYIRRVILQIFNDRIKGNKEMRGIQLVPKKDFQSGAYRLVVER